MGGGRGRKAIFYSLKWVYFVQESIKTNELVKPIRNYYIEFSIKTFEDFGWGYKGKTAALYAQGLLLSECTYVLYSIRSGLRLILNTNAYNYTYLWLYIHDNLTLYNGVLFMSPTSSVSKECKYIIFKSTRSTERIINKRLK